MCTISIPTFTLLHYLLKKENCHAFKMKHFFSHDYYLFNHSFIHLFFHISHSLLHSFIHSFIFLSYLILLLIYSNFPPSNSSLVLFPSIHSFIFIHSFIHSSISPFISFNHIFECHPPTYSSSVNFDFFNF